MQKALFLDRDGVINAEKNYVHRREDFEFLDGIFELCRAAQQQGFAPIVVSNQAGIARGYYTEADFAALTAWMLGEFAQQGVQIAKVYYCPYHPEHGVGQYKMDSPDRKPKPGMLLRAREELKIDLEHSMIVGDQATDMQAGKAAGVGTRILLSSGDADAAAQGDWNVAGSLDEIRSMYFGS